MKQLPNPQSPQSSSQSSSSSSSSSSSQSQSQSKLISIRDNGEENQTQTNKNIKKHKKRVRKSRKDGSKKQTCFLEFRRLVRSCGLLSELRDSTYKKNRANKIRKKGIVDRFALQFYQDK